MCGSAANIYSGQKLANALCPSANCSGLRGQVLSSSPYVPPLPAVLRERSVPLSDGVLIVAVGAAFFARIEIEKQIRLGLKR